MTRLNFDGLAEARRVIPIALFLAMLGCAQAADIFASVSPDGSPRYSTDAIDASYHLIHIEPGPARPPSAPAASPRAVSRRHALEPLIELVSRRHGMSPALVEAVISIESNRDPGAISPKGALGVMQLMPATAAQYGLTGANAWREPERNIDAGVRHLKDLLSRHHGNVALALAAYNAGSGAVARHRNRIPPFRETMLYVPAVLAKAAALNP